MGVPPPDHPHSLEAGSTRTIPESSCYKDHPMMYESQTISEHSMHPVGWALPLEHLGYNSLKVCSGDQPLCGDQIDFYRSADGSHQDLKVFFAGKSCALCRASASILMKCLAHMGYASAETGAFIDRVAGLLAAEQNAAGTKAVQDFLETTFTPIRQDLAALMGLTPYRTRLGCMLLPWKTYRKLLTELQPPVITALRLKPGSPLTPEHSRPLVTRIAPSPTGFLHLGHVLHLIYVWGVSKALKAKCLLRIEDHDQTRCRPAFETAILEDLLWLGFVDSEDILLATRQSQRLGRYREVLSSLESKGLVYACVCSRKTMKAAQEGLSKEILYQGTCRNLKIPLDTPHSCLRLRWPQDEAVTFNDIRHGPMIQFPTQQCGDMVLRDRQGYESYQFAAVVDDTDQGVNLIIRGDDLLDSVGRQIMLRRILGDPNTPMTYHHPLVYQSNHQKLSKRLQSESLASLRSKGLLAEDLFGKALYAGGVTRDPTPMSLEQIELLFQGDNIAKRPTVTS